MHFRILTVTTLLAVSAVGFAEDRFERSIPVSAQPDLYVATGSGNIQIHAGSGSEIHVIGHIHTGGWHFGLSSDGWSNGGPNADTKSRIARIVASPPIVQEGNSVKVGISNDHDLYNNISIDYDITVPAAVALNLKSGSGDINSAQVGRYLTAATGSGNIHTGGVHGPADVSSGSGDITLEQEGAGDVKVRTGSGNIRIRGLSGGLSARSGSGNITADGRLTGPATLSTGSGNLNLRLGPDAHFNLEASVGSGDIHIGFPGAPHTDEHSRHHLTAPINGGGPTLEARTGSGNIDISN